MKDLIIKSIQAIAKQDNGYAIHGTVSAVDLDEMTCDVVPLYEAPDLLGVSIFPRDEDGNIKKGSVSIPKLGSVVMCSKLWDADTFYVTMFSDLDYEWLNGKNYGGIPQVDPLTQKINILENAFNSFVATFNAHTHPYVNVATPAVTSPSSSPVTQTLTPTQKSELENPTVLHGNGQ